MKPGKATAEMAKILSDGQWHSIDELSALTGRYLRPEVVWRIAQKKGVKDTESGRKAYLSSALRYWRKLDLVERRLDSGMVEWRALDIECFRNYSDVGGIRKTMAKHKIKVPEAEVEAQTLTVDELSELVGVIGTAIKRAYNKGVEDGRKERWH